MNILYYDCFSGISGDMNLGAMIDLGVDPGILKAGLEGLHIDGWKIKIDKAQRHGITGTMVTVITESDDVAEHHHHGTGKQGAEHHHHHHHHHHHRNLSDIESIINNGELKTEVKVIALRIFRKIAEAEARVHNVPIDKIHFHEVGALDSIIDITGAAICFDALGISSIYVSDVELGGGRVKCEHGILPVPAPATAELINGFAVHTGGVDFEATTPTGAAILASMAVPAPKDLRFSISATGYGIGQKDNPALPNILRVFMGESVERNNTGHDSYLVQCNIDDMNPELSDYLSARLFDAGAQDVWYTPVVMKKGRPAITLSVICEEESLQMIKEILFTESTTIGLRVSGFIKETLMREFEEIESRFGKIIIKKSFHNGKLVSVKPESDTCMAIARETGLPMKEVIQEIIASYHFKLHGK